MAIPGIPISDLYELGDSLSAINSAFNTLDQRVANSLTTTGGTFTGGITGTQATFTTSISSPAFLGYGGFLTGMIGVPAAYVTADYVVAAPLVSGTNASFTNLVNAASFIGDGSLLTGIITNDKLPLLGGKLTGDLTIATTYAIDPLQFGATWNSVDSDRNWTGVAMSSNGTKRTAVVYDGLIYVSTDSGTTWTGFGFGVNYPGKWKGVAMSSDGTIQTVTEFQGQIYVSTDSGNTWTAKDNNKAWSSIAMSSDGTKQTATVMSGQIYVSTDSGNTWIAKASNGFWSSVAMSSDGTKQTAVAGINGSGQIYVSTDSGNTWTAKDSARDWRGIAMTSDGTKQTAVASGGQIYISTNSGNTWTAKDSNRSWRSIAMTSDGTKQTAVVNNGQIYVSTNSGNTWTAKESNRFWSGIAMSSDGSSQTAVVSDGLIYVTSTPLNAYNSNLYLQGPAYAGDTFSVSNSAYSPTVITQTVKADYDPLYSSVTFLTRNTTFPNEYSVVGNTGDVVSSSKYTKFHKTSLYFNSPEYLAAGNGSTNKSIKVTGSNYFVVGASSYFTVEFWIYVGAYPSTAQGVSGNEASRCASLIDTFSKTGGATTDGFCLGLRGDGTLIVHSGTTGSAPTAAVVPLGTWSHVVLTKISNTVYVGVNGIFTSAGISHPTISSVDGAFYIGGSPLIPATFAGGEYGLVDTAISDFRITIGNAMRYSSTAGYPVPITQFPSTNANTVNVDSNVILTGGLTVNGSITVPVGNYLNFSTNGNGHTAIYRNGGANGMEFFAASASRMFIADAGNVGIGTTTPAAKLEVVGTVAVNNSNYAFLRLGNVSNSGWAITKESSDDSFNIFQGAIQGSPVANRLRIDNSGNVGIGTTPNSKLTVSGNISASGFLYGNGSNLTGVALSSHTHTTSEITGLDAALATALVGKLSLTGGTIAGNLTLSPLPMYQLGADINGEAAGDESGRSVSMNSAGDRVAIGATYNDGTGSNAGHVRVYSWNGSAWTQLGTDINGEALGNYSGWSVSMNSAGDRVAIGATFNSSSGIFQGGHVRVYSWNGSAWTQLGTDIDGEATLDQSGYSVSMNSTGDRVAIGAITNDGTGTDAGHVRVYSWNGSAWTQLGTDINGEAAGDQSGWSVSMNSTGDRVAIGAITNAGTGSNAGHVRVYSWNGSAWTQLGTDINAEAINNYCGYSVSMNSAGDRVAIGAAYNSGSAGFESGHVRIFSWNGSAWTQLVGDIDGEASQDNSGWSVSMNSAGDRVAIGAPLNDGTGNSAGHVRVYSILSPTHLAGTTATFTTSVSAPALSGTHFGDGSRLTGVALTSHTHTKSQITDFAHTHATSEITGLDTALAGKAATSHTHATSQITGLDTALAGKAATSHTHATSEITGLDTALAGKLSLTGGTVTNNVTLSSFSTYQLGADILGESGGDVFGRSVSMNSAGDRVVIGAIGDDYTASNAGHVRIYSWNGSAWTQLGADIDGEAVNNNFGFSVSMNSAGDRVAIGGPYNDGTGFNSGHVRIYSWNGSAWTQLGTDINGEAAYDFFGWSVSINAAGDRVAIGATGNDGAGSSAGHVRIFSWNGSAWTQLGTDIDGDSSVDQSGYSVSMNSAGDRVAIGAIYDYSFGQKGHVRIFSWNGSAWIKLGADIDGEAEGDKFGYSVSMNSAGNRVAIGAPDNDGIGNSAGHVRVYSWNGSAWTQLGTDIDGEAAGDDFGSSVSMNSAGDRVAIGAPYNDSNYGEGNFAGHVRIYYWNGVTWSQLGAVIDGKSDSDYFGSSVSMNSAGDRVVIGATYLADVRSGTVRVYSIPSPTHLAGTTATFTNSVFASEIYGKHFGDGSSLTVIQGGANLRDTLNAKLDITGDASSLTETLVEPTIASTTYLDVSTGTLIKVSLTTSITTLEFVNVAVSPKVFSFVLQVVADGTARTIAWPASVKWPGAAAPTITSTSSKIDTFSFLTYDEGTTWFGYVIAQNH